MADKTTTLKTKTNDNVYPNVIGDNRKNAFVDSSTITHHFYDQTHKVGFQINNETNIKIQNSLQKPSGLTKTELVGVGTNGQENIEIGDNLTLSNGKLSATGGGVGSSIPVIEGTTSTTTTDGAYATYTIPEAQTSCFIFKCDLGTAFISYNDVFETYNGYLDAEGDVTDGSLKLNDLIVLSGSGTTIDIFFGNIGGGGSSLDIVTIEVASMPYTQTTIDVSKITNDTQFVNIKETSTNTNYLLYRVGSDFASCFSNELTQGKIVAYYYISTQQKQLYYFISSVGKLGKIFGNHDIQVPAVSSDNILPCTTADNGKVLSVVNGEAQWSSANTDILPLPSDASTSTYVLKAINGTVQWVKES